MRQKFSGRLFRKFSLALCLFEEGWSLDLFGLFIPLPGRCREVRSGEIMESWGFGWYERSIHFNWGHRTKIIYLPWDWDHVKCEVQRPDGSWVPYVGCWEDKDPDGRWEETYPYTYTLESGEVQNRTATVYVERREWRWRWLKWLPWPCKKRKSIDVAFDGEVGERTGSWKGGTVGCGYDIRDYETAKGALRRMESERKF